MAVVGSVLGGVLVAVLASFGVIQVAENATPAPVEKPLIVYGQR